MDPALPALPAVAAAAAAAAAVPALPAAAGDRIARSDRPPGARGRSTRRRTHDRSHAVTVLGLRAKLIVSGSPAARVAAIAARQRGRVARRQLLAVGLSESQITGLCGRDRLFPVHAGVYTVGHPGPVALGAETAALLAGPDGAVLSHRSAAALWGMRGMQLDPDRVDVLIDNRASLRRPGIHTHRSRHLDTADARVRSSLPVTSPARTLLDLAMEIAPADLERVYDEAIIAKLLSPADCTRILARLLTHPGAARLQTLLANPDAGLTESEAERLLASLLRKSDLPRPRRQVWMEGYRLDCYWPDARLALETDGYLVHNRRRRFESDRVRDARLHGVGVECLRVTWRQLADEPFAAVARIAAALARRTPIPTR